MKTFLIAVSFGLLLLLLPGMQSADAEKYSVEILQNGAPVPVIDGTVQLEKKEFQIRITLKNIEGIYLSTSFNRDYYDLKSSDSIPDFAYLPAKTNAEESFNVDKSLIVHDEYVCYWFYNPKMDWHRFDKEVVSRGNEHSCTKTVATLFNQATGERIKLKQNDKALYLFFVAVENAQEQGRLKLKIEWK